MTTVDKSAGPGGVTVRRRAGLYALLAADTVSALGVRMSVVAIPWLVLVATKSPAKMGMAAGAEMALYVLSGVFATPLADRFGLRRVSVLTDVVSAAAIAVIALVPDISFGLLLVLVSVAGALRGTGDRVKHVLLKPMAERADVPMIRVTAVYESLTRGAMLVGAPLGGLLIYWFDAELAIGVTAVTFGLCGLLVAVFVAAEHTPAPKKVSGEPYAVAFKAGVRCLLSHRVLAGMTLIMFFSNLFTQAATAVFVPVWVEQTKLSEATLGLVGGVYAGGVMLGSIVMTVLATKVPRYLAFTLGAMLGGAPRLLALGLTDNLYLVLAVTALSGLAISPVNPIFGAMLYERIPADLQTRVFGLVAGVCFSGIPIGSVVAGWAVPAAGLATSVIAFAVLCLAICSLPLFKPAAWRAMDDKVPADT